MLILGIASSTDQVGCAIGGHEGVIAAFELTKGRRHAETLAPAIEFIRASAGVELSELGAIAVDVGPGLFTGLRVGMATANALATGLAIPMVGISSLDLLAHPARISQRLIAAVIDARRGEVFYALYRPVPGGVQRMGEFKLGTPSELAARLQAMDGELYVVGDGAQRYREEFEALKRCEIADTALAYPSAQDLVQLAHARAVREEFERPGKLTPIYLRKPDAEINWERGR